jgi:hypothetical protein
MPLADRSIAGIILIGRNYADSNAILATDKALQSAASNR